MSDPVDYNGGAARLRLHRRRSIGYKFERSIADAATRLRAFSIHSAGGGCFNARLDYCKAKTLVIQNNTLIWK